MMLDYYPTNIVDFIDYFQILVLKIDKIYICTQQYKQSRHLCRHGKQG